MVKDIVKGVTTWADAQIITNELYIYTHMHVFLNYSYCTDTWRKGASQNTT